MIHKILGAILIVAGCGGFGMSICLTHKKEEDMLHQLIRSLEWMQCELQYHLTPLPELCAKAAACSAGTIQNFLTQLGWELSRQTAPDAVGCIEDAMAAVRPLPPKVEKVLQTLAQSLGQFDVQGQIAGLEAASTQCRLELETLTQNRETRLRSYQTLAFCTGAALVILLV